jgi:hypothetical protein
VLPDVLVLLWLSKYNELQFVLQNLYLQSIFGGIKEWLVPEKRESWHEE